MLVVSYMPLLNKAPTNIIAGEEDIKNFSEAAKEACERACGKGVIWVRSEEGALSPVFIFEDGDQIIQHLLEWSEGKPSDWFDLHIVELTNGKVQFLVSPRYLKSIERHKINHPDMDLSTCQVIYTPLQITIDKSAFCEEYLAQEKTPKTTVGVLDFDYVIFGDPMSLKLDKVMKQLELDLCSVYNTTANASVLSFIDGELKHDYGFLYDYTKDHGDGIVPMEDTGTDIDDAG